MSTSVGGEAREGPGTELSSALMRQAALLSRRGRKGLKISTILLGVELAIAFCLLVFIDRTGYRVALALCWALVALTLAAWGALQMWAQAKLAASTSVAAPPGPASGNSAPAVVCEYCGSDGCAVLCKNCKLVQAGRLRVHGGRPLLWAAYACIHRWQILGAMLPFVSLNAIAICVHVHERERSERAASLTAAQQVADAGSAFRGALLAIEAICPSPRSPDCGKHVEALREGYYKYSFGAPAIIDELRELCSRWQLPWPAPPESRQAMCALGEAQNYEHMIDALNVNFRRYMNAVASCGVDDAACVVRRRGLAEVLYENGRLAQCAVAEVAYDIMFFSKAKTYRTYEKCKAASWHAPPSMGGDDELDWQRWPVPASATAAARTPTMQGREPPSPTETTRPPRAPSQHPTRRPEHRDGEKRSSEARHRRNGVV
jgi:hypothetical protein